MSFLRPTASACTSQGPSWLSTIDESQSGKSPPITYSSPSSPSLTPIVLISVSAPAKSSPSPTGTTDFSLCIGNTVPPVGRITTNYLFITILAFSHAYCIDIGLCTGRTVTIAYRDYCFILCISNTVPVTERSSNCPISIPSSTEDNRLDTDLAGGHPSSEDTFIVVDANCYHKY
ncbi:hypothetical protein EDB83DRAFT_2535682 [Lactarius deliciosus]|nr:hypothetical protein EDB83DRAFT_2535682 [Lactarius deliciosus]